MSPRRSSRAHTTQPPPSAREFANSSSSSVASSHTEGRGSAQKLSPPLNLIFAPSPSVDGNTMTKPQPRRTRSSQDDEKEQNTSAIEDDIDGEEEITRCICGNQDYPGLPIANNNSKPKSDSDPPSFTEDATGWFIQCDNCHVWQHGGCVGLLDENTSPDEYFCEQCHPELHRVATMANGYDCSTQKSLFADDLNCSRKHSHYVPAEDANSDHSSPVPTPKSNSRKSRDSKAAQMNSATVDKGRRSTMNSRDAAYEEEQLRLAIEESKREGGHSAGTRKGKRGRSESEE